MIKTILAGIGLTFIMLIILSFTTIFPIKTMLTTMAWVGEDIFLGEMALTALLLIIINSILIYTIERVL